MLIRLTLYPDIGNTGVQLVQQGDELPPTAEVMRRYAQFRAGDEIVVKGVYGTIKTNCSVSSSKGIHTPRYAVLLAGVESSVTETVLLVENPSPRRAVVRGLHLQGWRDSVVADREMVK